ncbi:MAG TPA: hypothetical protein VKV57_17560 [bacterium]|nr:hypothetical protein [bacterium]
MPADPPELREKFATLTREVISPGRGEEIGAMIDRLEDVEDIGALARLLGREHRPGASVERRRGRPPAS